MLKYASLTCALMLSAVALSAQVTSVIPAVQTTGMVGLGDAQTAQLNLLNPGVEPPAAEQSARQLFRSWMRTETSSNP